MVRKQWILAACLMAAGCRQQQQQQARPETPAQQRPEPRTDDDKTFYTLGADIARTQWAYKMSEAEYRMFERGFHDTYFHLSSPVNTDEYRPKVFSIAMARAELAAKAENDRSKGFITEAALEPGAQKFPSGLVLREVLAGTGESPTPSDFVTVHYRGTLIDGTEFDSSYGRGEPNRFTLRAAMPCWVEALQKMKAGGKAKIVCPASLGYGDKGDGSMVVGGATIAFDLELVAVSHEAPSPKASLPKP